jgi:mannose/cellobiose epimerase-like protein (N-acyl-D-glucosamine 2-epimerase family)
MENIKKTSAELFAAQALASQVKKELTENILPYWMQKMIRPDGGLYGQIDGKENLVPDAPIGNIMTARMLWTFASAYRVLGNEEYLKVALKAKDFIIKNFYDAELGGTYWSLNPDGSPLDTKKQIYAIAFTIYGLAELNRATGDGQALEYAIKLFNSIEDHSFDTEKDGYFEAFTREWNQIEDMRLSEKDANESKTMNTHLHVLEAYTCLYRVWKNARLEERLRGLIAIFEEKILLYRKHLIIDDKALQSNAEYPMRGINEIMRLHLTRFTQKMDNPTVPIDTFDEDGNVITIHVQKSYYINIVFQLQHDGSVKYHHFRITMTRDGVLHIVEL